MTSPTLGDNDGNDNTITTSTPLSGCEKQSQIRMRGKGRTLEITPGGITEEERKFGSGKAKLRGKEGNVLENLRSSPSSKVDVFN